MLAVPFVKIIRTASNITDVKIDAQTHVGVRVPVLTHRWLHL